MCNHSRIIIFVKTFQGVCTGGVSKYPPYWNEPIFVPKAHVEVEGDFANFDVVKLLSNRAKAECTSSLLPSPERTLNLSPVKAYHGLRKRPRRPQAPAEPAPKGTELTVVGATRRPEEQFSQMVEEPWFNEAAQRIERLGTEVRH